MARVATTPISRSELRVLAMGIDRRYDHNFHLCCPWVLNAQNYRTCTGTRRYNRVHYKYSSLPHFRCRVLQPPPRSSLFASAVFHIPTYTTCIVSDCDRSHPHTSSIRPPSPYRHIHDRHARLSINKVHPVNCQPACFVPPDTIADRDFRRRERDNRTRLTLAAFRIPPSSWWHSILLTLARHAESCQSPVSRWPSIQI